MTALKRTSADRKKKSPFSIVSRAIQDFVIAAVARELGITGIQKLRKDLETAFSDIDVVDAEDSENDEP